MKRLLLSATALLFGLLPADANLLLYKAGGNGGGPNPDSLLIVTPFNHGTLLQLNTFLDANTACNFYNTNLVGPPVKECAAANDFFSGTHSTDAQLGVIRAGQSGSRARNIGATICEVPCANLAACQALGDCASAAGATTQLANLQAVTNGSLNWTQDDVTLSATGINLSAATSLSQIATIVQTAMDAVPPVTGFNGATLSSSSIAPFTCPNLQGEIGAGYLTITVAPSACVYPGGTVTAPNGTTGVVLGQYSGTPNGAGVYSLSSQIQTANNPTSFVPSLMTAANPGSEAYSVLTVGTIGPSDVIRSGAGLYATTPTVVNSGIYGQLVGGVSTQLSFCGGDACAGTQWILGSASLTVASESMTTSVCNIQVTYEPYYGNTVNRNRYWMEQRPTCTAGAPSHSMSYVTSNSTSIGDNLASLMGWGPPTTAPGGSPGVVPALPYSGDWLSPQSEVIGDTNSSYSSTWPNWLTYVVANVPGVSSFANWQWTWNVDAGDPGQTYTNAIRGWFASNPAYRFLDVWSWPATAYPQANYALNSPYGPPTCHPGYQQFTVASGSFTATPDYCYNHDVILEGAAGSSAQEQSSGLPGGVGASGANVYMTGLTGSAGAITGPTFQIGVGGGANVVPNRTEITTSWGLYTTTSSLLYAVSGGNATATASGVAGAQAPGCAINLLAGAWNEFESGAVYCRAGVSGVTLTTFAGAGGPGGSSGSTLVGLGKVGGGGASAGGMGGGGTSGVGGSGTTGVVGFSGGTYLDGTTPGAGGTGNPGTPGGAPSGGGGGENASGAVAGGNGAAGHKDTEFATLTHPCPGGPGGGGGGAGGNKSPSGSPPGTTGGNGADFGGSGAGGAGTTQTPAALGQPGAPGNGVACWIGY